MDENPRKAPQTGLPRYARACSALFGLSTVSLAVMGFALGWISTAAHAISFAASMLLMTPAAFHTRRWIGWMWAAFCIGSICAMTVVLYFFV